MFTAVDYSQETEEIELSSIHLANKAVQVSFPNVGFAEESMTDELSFGNQPGKEKANGDEQVKQGSSGQ